MPLRASITPKNIHGDNQQGLDSNLDTLLETPQEQHARRKPLGNLSSNPSSNSSKKNSRITFRKIGRLRGLHNSGKRNSSPTFSFDNQDVASQGRNSGFSRIRRTFSKSPSEQDENQSPSDLLLGEQIVQLQQTCDTLASSSTDIPDEVVTTLRIRLEMIHQGLHSVESNRTKLTETAQALSKERKELQHQLEMREKELQSLSKRCAQQSEKLKAVHQLQASHNTLCTQVTDATAALDEQRKIVQDLEKQLAAAEAQKHNLQERLERVNQDYSRVSEQLDVSLKDLERLTEEKQQWQTERSRLEQQMNWQKQQQQVTWMEERGTLQQQVASKEELIQMLRDEIAKLQKTEQEFEKEMHQMTVRHENELESKQEDEHARLQELQERHLAEIEKLRDERASAAKLESQLDQLRLEHEEEIRALREEHLTVLEVERDKCARLQEELSQERKAGHELLRVQAEQHDQDEQALISDFEKLLADEVASIRKEHNEKVAELQTSLSEHEETVQNLERQLEQLHRDRAEEESEMKRAREIAEQRMLDEHNTLVTELRRTIDDQQKQIDTLLLDQETNAQKIDDINQEAESRIEKLQTLHQTALDRLQRDALVSIKPLQDALQEKHARVNELEGVVKEWERRYRGQSDVYSRSVCDSKAKQIELTEKIKTLTDQVKGLTEENHEKIQTCENLVAEKETLSQNLSDLQSVFDAHKSETAKERLELESKVVDLEKSAITLAGKAEERALIIETLEAELAKAMGDLMVASGELENARADTELVNNLTSDLEVLQLENASAHEALHDRDVQIAELEAEILKLEMENEIERQQTAKLETANDSRKATHTREVQSLRNYISELRRDLDQASRQLVDYRRLHAKSQSIVERLEEELRAALEQTSSSSDSLHSQHLKELDRIREGHGIELKILEDRIACLENDLSRSVQAHTSQMKVKDKAIAALTEQLEDIREKNRRLTSDGHAEFSLTREQLHNCRVELSHRDDEINGLKCQIIPKLENKVRELTARLEEYEQKIITLETFQSNLEKERDELAEVIAEKSAKNQTVSEELLDTIESQKRQLTESSKNLRKEQELVENLRSELENALHQCEVNKACAEQTSNLLSQIENMKRDAKLVQAELREEKAISSDLKGEIRQLKLDLESQEHRNEQLKLAYEKVNREVERLGNDLNQKTRQHADAASKVSVSNTELDACRQRLRESDARIDGLELSLADSKAECLRLATALGEKDAECMALVEQERTLKELCNEELEELKSKFELINNERQSNAELVKEIAELKNKIRRQEAYLQRRLNKERIARQRNSNIGNQETSRGDHPFPRTVKRSGSFSSHASGPRPIVPEVSLIDWDSSSVELDSLLAD